MSEITSRLYGTTKHMTSSCQVRLTSQTINTDVFVLGLDISLDQQFLSLIM